MKVMTQLAFDGQCREAFERYATVLGGRITVMNTFGGHRDKALPPGSADAGDDKVRFAELQIGEQAILGNDLPPGQFERMQGFNVSIHTRDRAEARRIFEGLVVGGEVHTALVEVEWAALFGMLTDRFGVPWLILALDEPPGPPRD